MSIEVKPADGESIKKWDQWLQESRGGTFFHQSDILEVIANHSGAEIHHLIGYKGQHPVGVFPLFELSKGPIKMIFSPPPSLNIPRLGPVLFDRNQLKQHKSERRNRRFINGCLEWVEKNIAPKYIRIVSTVSYQDTRPFSWDDFNVSPSYTYHVDISVGEEEVMKRFKKSLRSDIRRSQDKNYEIREGDEDDVRFVIEKVRERYEVQGKEYRITPEYAIDLQRAVGKDQLPVYVGEIEGERVSGILTPRFDSTLYFWQGGGKPEVSLPMNDLIHWKIIRDGIEGNYTVYDLVGANNQRLCEYKAKFNPELRTYYTIERGTMIVDAVSDIYKWFR
jgi:hypothetical protein